MNQDRIYRQNFKVTEDEGIIHLNSFKINKTPEESLGVAKLTQEDIFKILNKDVKKEFHLLVSLPPGVTKGFASRKAKDLYKEIATHSQIQKIALVGGNAFVKTLTIFIIAAGGKSSKMKWFSSKDKAEAWLGKG
jgi:hypothetical protein